MTCGLVLLPHSPTPSLRTHYSLLQCFCMTTQEKVESLIQQAAELPDDAQAQLVQSLVEMRCQHLGFYHFDEEERTAGAGSAEDIRLGRFATAQDI